MATFIPDGILSSLKGCEDKIAQILKKLPDDCLVYHEAAISGRSQADFIVIFPEVGVLVIEAKGWPISDITHADSQNYTHSAFGKNKHPQRQARDYMHLLMERCKKSHFSKFLVAEDGSYKGRFVFPFAYIAAFCNVNREEFEDRFPGVFPNPTNVTKDELQELRNLAGRELVLALKSLFSPVWPIERMSGSQLDAIRAIIHPGSQINDLAVLDVQQEQIAYAMGDGHRLVYGVVGSGKTVILAARVKWFAERNSNERHLVLCYNKLLKEDLESKFSDFKNIDVFTFHGWAYKNGIKIVKNEDIEFHAQRLLDHFEKNQGFYEKYQSISIDEVQYAAQGWVKCAVLNLNHSDPKKANLLVVGDGTQNFFNKKRSWRWIDADLHVSGRTKQLNKNYRNTAEIIKVSETLAAPPSAEVADEQMINSPANSINTSRRGRAPEIVKLRSRGEEAKYAAALIETWLRGGVIISGQRQKLRPSDIAIIYPREPSDGVIQVLIDELNKLKAPVWLSSSARNVTLKTSGVKIIPSTRCAGLQFRAVICIWCDLDPSEYDFFSSKNLLYVAFTRAEEVLVILHSDDTPSTQAIQKAISEILD